MCHQQVLSGGVTFNGRMDLSDAADNTFCLLEYYGRQGSQPPDLPSYVYFTRWVLSVFSCSSVVLADINICVFYALVTICCLRYLGENAPNLGSCQSWSSIHIHNQHTFI